MGSLPGAARSEHSDLAETDRKGNRIDSHEVQVMNQGKHADRYAVKHAFRALGDLDCSGAGKIRHTLPVMGFGNHLKARSSRIGHDGLPLDPRERKLMKRRVTVAPSARDIDLVSWANLAIHPVKPTDRVSSTFDYLQEAFTDGVA